MDTSRLELLKKQYKELPSYDYRVCTEKIDKPSGLLIGGKKLLEEFSEISKNKIKELKGNKFVLVEESVQLYLFAKNHSANMHQPIAFFPIDEPKLIGTGIIKLDPLNSLPYSARLCFFNKEDNSRGYLINATNQIDLFSFYQFDDGGIGDKIARNCRLKQFGNDSIGWRKPDEDVEEKLRFRTTIRIDDNHHVPTKEILTPIVYEIEFYKQYALSLGIRFKTT